MNKTKQYLLVLLCIGIIIPCAGYADIAVIIHPSNTTKMNEKYLRRIYLDQRRTFPNGDRVIPINQPEKSFIRRIFTKKVLKKSPQKLRNYWTKKIFSGSALKPEEKANDKEVKNFVSSNPKAIGYIDIANLDESVKIVLLIK